MESLLWGFATLCHKALIVALPEILDCVLLRTKKFEISRKTLETMAAPSSCSCSFARAIECNNAGVERIKMGDAAQAIPNFQRALNMIREPWLLAPCTASTSEKVSPDTFSAREVNLEKSGTACCCLPNSARTTFRAPAKRMNANTILGKRILRHGSEGESQEGQAAAAQDSKDSFHALSPTSPYMAVQNLPITEEALSLSCAPRSPLPQQGHSVAPEKEQKDDSKDPGCCPGNRKIDEGFKLPASIGDIVLFWDPLYIDLDLETPQPATHNLPSQENEMRQESSCSTPAVTSPRYTIRADERARALELAGAAIIFNCAIAHHLLQLSTTSLSKGHQQRACEDVIRPLPHGHHQQQNMQDQLRFLLLDRRRKDKAKRLYKKAIDFVRALLEAQKKDTEADYSNPSRMWTNGNNHHQQTVCDLIMMASLNNLLVLMEAADENRSPLISYFAHFMLAQAAAASQQQDLHSSSALGHEVSPRTLSTRAPHSSQDGTQLSPFDIDIPSFEMACRGWRDALLANALLMLFRAAGGKFSSTGASAA